MPIHLVVVNQFVANYPCPGLFHFLELALLCWNILDQMSL